MFFFCFLISTLLLSIYFAFIIFSFSYCFAKVLNLEECIADEFKYFALDRVFIKNKYNPVHAVSKIRIIMTLSYLLLQHYQISQNFSLVTFFTFSLTLFLPCPSPSLSHFICCVL